MRKFTICLLLFSVGVYAETLLNRKSKTRMMLTRHSHSKSGYDEKTIRKKADTKTGLGLQVVANRRMLTIGTFFAVAFSVSLPLFLSYLVNIHVQEGVSDMNRHSGIPSSSHGWMYTSISHYLLQVTQKPNNVHAAKIGFPILAALAVPTILIRFWPVYLGTHTIIPANLKLLSLGVVVGIGFVFVGLFNSVQHGYTRILHFTGAVTAVLGGTAIDFADSLNMFQQTHSNSRPLSEVALADVALIYEIINVIFAVLVFPANILENLGLLYIKPTKTSSPLFSFSEWMAVLMLSVYFALFMYPWAWMEHFRTAR